MRNLVKSQCPVEQINPNNICGKKSIEYKKYFYQ